MAMRSSQQSAPEPRGEAFFDRRDVVLSRINKIVTSRELLSQTPMPLLKQEVARTQVAKAVQQNTQMDLPADVAPSPELVALDQQKRAQTFIQQTRQEVASVYDGGGQDVSIAETQPDQVPEAPKTLEVLAAEQVVNDALGEQPVNNVTQFPRRPQPPQPPAAWTDRMAS